jgi:uncharacterized membrane protein YkoI
MTRTIVALGALALSVLAGACQERGGPGVSEPPRHAGRQPAPAGAVGFAEAVDIATRHLPGGTPIEVSLELAPALRPGEDYHVVIFKDGRLYDVQVDRQSGQVTDQDVDDVDGVNDLARLETLADTLRDGASLRGTAAMAEQNYNVDALREIEMELQEGQLVAEVNLRLNREAVEWQIDPATGRIMDSDRSFVPGS